MRTVLVVQRRGDEILCTLVRDCLVGIICHRCTGGAGVFLSRIRSFNSASLLAIIISSLVYSSAIEIQILYLISHHGAAVLFEVYAYNRGR